MEAFWPPFKNSQINGDEFLEKIDEFLRVSRSFQKAAEYIGKTIEKVNEDTLLDAYNILQNQSEIITIGTKNTAQIERKYIKRLIETGKYVWHTIDKMTDGGRAVDVNLVNPLTLRPMTGSSSATGMNVLMGINDIGLGTDGGGSVLAPALSLNLFSIMAKGMGLKGILGRKSTDGISFVPGIGIISQSFELAKDALFSILNIRDERTYIEKIKAAVCYRGNIMLPGGADMREKLSMALYRLKEKKVDIQEVEMPDFRDRSISIEKVKRIFEETDIIITWEGPVDMLGIGDSVFGTMGLLAKEIQANSGKYMVKIANMVDATSITIPSDEAASGLVITSKPGIESGLKALYMANELKNLYRMPDLYYDYFKNGCLRRKNDLIFSLGEE